MRLFGLTITRERAENRGTDVSDIRNPSAWLLNALGGSVRSGAVVNPVTAMNVTAVYACVRVLAETVASIPVILYRKQGEKRERAASHPLYRLLHDEPNSLMTSYEFKELLQGHLGLRGNAYSFLEQDGAGRVRELLPLPPQEVEVFLTKDREPVYRYGSEMIPSRRILHLKGLSSDGVLGYAPITLMREAIGLAMATEAHGAELFANGAFPGGLLQYPGKLTTEQAERITTSWRSRFGAGRRFGVGVLEEGMTWQSVGMPSKDSQFLETRQFQVAEIARAFRVPPHKIGDLARATFSNIEHQSIEFLTDTIRPWLARWAQALNRVLLTEAEKAAGYYFEFLTDAVLAADTKTRFGAYGMAIKDGWMSRNEVRARENLNPMEGLDEFLRPLNMATGEQDGAGNPDDKQEEEEDNDDKEN